MGLDIVINEEWIQQCPKEDFYWPITRTSCADIYTANCPDLISIILTRETVELVHYAAPAMECHRTALEAPAAATGLSLLLHGHAYTWKRLKQELSRPRKITTSQICCRCLN